MLSNIRFAQVVNVDHNTMPRGKCNYRHPGGPFGHLEPSKEFPDKLQFVEEVRDTNAGRAVHEEYQVDLTVGCAPEFLHVALQDLGAGHVRAAGSSLGV